MIRTNNLWAPVTTRGRKPWILWTCVRSTRREAKQAYLEGIDEKHHEHHLARIKFMKVFVEAHDIKVGGAA